MKTKNNNDLSAGQKAFVKKVVRDPVLFANHILGVTLWEREAEILHSIQHRRRTAIKACHGVGKTFVLADATLWWLARKIRWSGDWPTRCVRRELRWGWGRMVRRGVITIWI